MIPHPEDEVVRKRSASERGIMALLLGAFVILLFLITVAKIGTATMTALAQRNARIGDEDGAAWRWRCSASPSPRCRSTACSAR